MNEKKRSDGKLLITPAVYADVRRGCRSVLDIEYYDGESPISMMNSGYFITFGGPSREYHEYMKIGFTTQPIEEIRERAKTILKGMLDKIEQQTESYEDNDWKTNWCSVAVFSGFCIHNSKLGVSFMSRNENELWEKAKEYTDFINSK